MAILYCPTKGQVPRKLFKKGVGLENFSRVIEGCTNISRPLSFFPGEKRLGWVEGQWERARLSFFQIE